MITAYAVQLAGAPVLKIDKAAADDYAVRYGGTVHELVEKAAILRKFDAYVPADQASSLRYRVAELEAQVEALQEELARYVLPAAAVVITSPAAIEAAFEADDSAPPDLAAFAGRVLNDSLDEQCDELAGLPKVGVGALA
jgi:hypothetical protein